MSAEPRDRHAKGWGSYVTFVVAVLALYVASMGPACRLCFDYHRSPNAISIIYRPVWEAASWPIVGRPLAAYLSLWGTTWKAEYAGRERGVLITAP
jgi:hypothetical protein